jgi:hypothetical protein
VLGPDVVLRSASDSASASVELPDAGQVITFVAAPDRRRQGIVGCGLTLAPVPGVEAAISTEIGGVRFTVTPTGEERT